MAKMGIFGIMGEAAKMEIANCHTVIEDQKSRLMYKIRTNGAHVSMYESELTKFPKIISKSLQH